MVAVRQKTVTQMRLRGKGETHARTRVRARDVSTVVDEPAARGGTDEGPTPTETLIASLVGCTNVIAHRIAERMGVVLEDVEIEAVAAFDRRGAMLEEELERPFERIDLTVRCRSDAGADEIAAIRRDLARFCPVAKVIRNAGTPIEETWEVSALGGTR